MQQTKTAVPALREALTQPENGDNIKITIVTLTPRDVEQIIENMGYQRQRPTNTAHIGHMADAMVNNDFIEGRMITFGPEDDGDHVLIDGQHRLLAAINANWTGIWTICTLWGDHYNARDTYIKLDTSQKERTPANVGRAVGYDLLTIRIQNIIVAAARYQNEWDKTYTKPPFAPRPPHRDNRERITSQMQAYLDCDELINDKQHSALVRRRLSSPMNLAVLAETIHNMPDEANGFWTAVASNGGGIAAELREKLIAGRPKDAPSVFYTARLMALAWNQRASDTKLRQDNRNEIKVHSTNLAIPL